MVDVCSPQNYTNITFLFYMFPEIQFFSPQQTVNQITERNTIILFTSSLFLSLRKPQKYGQLQL